MKKVKCELCGQDISKSNISKHMRRHQNHPETFEKKPYSLDHDDLFCKYCRKECKSVSSVRTHERLCKENPNKQESYFVEYNKQVCNRKRSAWNKGKTKETDERILKSSITRKVNNKEKGTSSYGHAQSQETKEKLRQIGLSKTYKRKCKKQIQYVKKDGTIVVLDSTFEVKLAQILDSIEIDWTQPQPVEWVDKNNKVHHYFSDFYLPNYNIFLDPKNEYCFQVQQEKINYILSHYKNMYFLHNYEITETFIIDLLSNKQAQHNG